MKRAYSICVLFLLLVFFLTVAHGAEFWGSKNSNKYHYPTCRWAQKIKSYNLKRFSSPEEAVKAGYIPCKVCRPPLPTKSSINNNRVANSGFFDASRKKDFSSLGMAVSMDLTDRATGLVICCDGTLSPTCTC